MTQWLAQRMMDVLGYTNPRFALFGTVNWMRALSIQVDPYLMDESWRGTFYSGVSRGKADEARELLIFQQLMFALHSLAGLMALAEEVGNKADISKASVDAWHDTITTSATAMFLASSQNDQVTDLSYNWGLALVDDELVLPPFSFSVSDLTKASREHQLSTLRGVNKSDLNLEPTNIMEAYGGLISYLSGTCDYVIERAEQKVKRSEQFEALGVDSFRTNAARLVRDEVLKELSVNFVDQANRYHGKIKHRDCIFLSYGHENYAQLDQFIQDMVVVAKVFFTMSCTYSRRRLGDDLWLDFVEDVNTNSRLSLQID